MELKNKLKKLRQEKGLTQSQLAQAIFVSRSTVAKWENGLGLPSAESMRLLEEQFGVTRSEITTTEPEAVIVEKNLRIRWSLIGSIAGWTAMIVLIIAMYILPFAIQNGDYGFTPKMVAGSFDNSPYIDTGDYRIYYTVFEGDWADGRHWTSLATFKPVRKHFWGCTVSEEDYEADVILHNNHLVGRLYSIKGKDGYYNIIKNTIGNPVQEDLVNAQAIHINGTEYELQHGFFFITPEAVEYFKIGDAFFNVE